MAEPAGSPPHGAGVADRGSVVPNLRKLVDRGDLDLLVTVAVTLLVYVVGRRALSASASLPEAAYARPLIAGALLAEPARLLVATFPAALLVLRVPWRWRDLPSGRVLRTFVGTLVAVGAWTGSAYEYNAYFGHLHAWDRGAVVALAVGAWLTPLLVPAFVLAVLAMFRQFDLPLGGDATDWRPLIDALVLFAAWHVSCATRRARAGHFAFLALVLLAVEYYYQGLYKVALGPTLSWVFENRLANLFVAANGRGWLAGVPGETILSVAEALRTLQVPSALAVVALELAAVLLFVGRRTCAALMGAWIALHVVIFALSGILFWKWIVLDLSLLLLLYRLDPGELRPAFLPRLVGPGLGLLVVLGLSFIFSPPYLAWYDSPLDERYEIEVVGTSGRSWMVPPCDMAPYDKAFAQGRFWRADPHWHLAGTYGGVVSHALYARLREAGSAEGVRRLAADRGRPAYDPRYAMLFDGFLRRWFADVGRRGRRATLMTTIGPPQHIWTMRRGPAHDAREPARLVRVWRVVQYHDGERVGVVERLAIREVAVTP